MGAGTNGTGENYPQGNGCSAGMHALTIWDLDVAALSERWGLSWEHDVSRNDLSKPCMRMLFQRQRHCTKSIGLKYGAVVAPLWHHYVKRSASKATYAF